MRRFRRYPGPMNRLYQYYTHKSGEERKLTFLTDQAEEVNQRIASQRTG